jgi:hypothetical protein
MTPISEIVHTEPKKIKCEWESDEFGNASLTTKSYHSGEVSNVDIMHDAVTPPAAAYDIFILNNDGNDILCGAGKDIAPIENKMLTKEQCSLGAVSNSELTFNISGTGGSGKKGTIIVYLR